MSTRDIEPHLRGVVQNAMAAFWAEVAEGYPEVKSGDLYPETVLHFEDTATRVVAAWLSLNQEEN